MSLVKTLAKVAIGVAVAKGVSHIAKNGLPGAGGATYAPNPGRGSRIGTAGGAHGSVARVVVRAVPLMPLTGDRRLVGSAGRLQRDAAHPP